MMASSSAIDLFVAVINSVGVREERVDINISVLQENGFEIVERHTAILSSSEATALSSSSVASESLSSLSSLSSKTPSPLDDGHYPSHIPSNEIVDGGHSGLPPPPSNVFTPNDFLQGPCVILLLKKRGGIELFNKIKGNIDYTYYSPHPYIALRDRELFFQSSDQWKLERTVLIIKPDFSDTDRQSIEEALDKEDFVVVGKKPLILSDEIAKEISSDSKEEIDYITSGVSLCLAIERLNAINTLHLLVGPVDPVIARDYSPASLRAKLGSDKIHNSIYISPNEDIARKEIQLLFNNAGTSNNNNNNNPSSTVIPPTFPSSFFPLERTVLIIKPDALLEESYIINHLIRNGFQILARDQLLLSSYRAEQLYAEEKESTNINFSSLVSHMSSGPIIIYLLSKISAISHLQKLIGPTDPIVARMDKPSSIRARIGKDRIKNAVSASKDEEDVTKEIKEYFPSFPVESIPTIQNIHEILTAKPAPRPYLPPLLSLQDVLIEGLTQLCRVKPKGDDAILYLADWLDKNNPFKPKIEFPPEDDDDDNDSNNNSSINNSINNNKDGKNIIQEEKTNERVELKAGNKTVIVSVKEIKSTSKK